MKREGDQVVVHKLRGRTSNRRLKSELRQQATELIRAHYADFGPTLASEYLRGRHDLKIGKETIRQWMIQAHLWKPQRAIRKDIHVWRQRRDAWGELVQWDTSEHAWLEGRGPKLYLIAMIDDATSRAWARFAEHDSMAENMRLLWSYLERFGRPLEFYTDKASLFCGVAPRQHQRQPGEPNGTSQVQRALRQLGIGWIAAHSPQAKGRIERFFGTAQDRLVKGLRLAGAATLAQANQYLEQEYLPMWDSRFSEAPFAPQDAHRPLLAEHRLADILCRIEQRTVDHDLTIRWKGQRWLITGSPDLSPLAGDKVDVLLRLDRYTRAELSRADLCRATLRRCSRYYYARRSGPPAATKTESWIRLDEKVPTEGLAPLRRTVSAWLLQSNLKSNRSAGPKRPGGLRVHWPKASAPKLHHPDMATSKSKTLGQALEGSWVADP